VIGGAFELIPVPLLATAVGEPVGLVKVVNEVPAVDVAVAVDAELEDGFRELSSMIKTH
jgi:hypothetical protein